MATKKCVNGHQYDSSIYGDKCPFCPSESGSTKVHNDFHEDGGTKILGGNDPVGPTQTLGGEGHEAAGGATVIRHKGKTVTGETGVAENRRLVGLLVSYSAVATGEVYKVFEGRTTIGRDRTCDIPFPGDSHMSSKHLLIQYVEAKGVFRAQEYDKGSANGSFVNGEVYVLGDVVELKDKDVIVIGGTKFVFLVIPEF